MERVASQFIRALRGQRSQIQFARRLGYSGNPITDWERGQRFPTAEETLRAAALTGIDVVAATSRFSPGSALRRGRDGFAVAEWLTSLRGSTPLNQLADHCGQSRFSISRWLNGKAKPRLPDFFTLVDGITGRLPEWVAELVPIERVPLLQPRFVAAGAAKRLAFEAPWTEAVLRLLETRGYQGLRAHRRGYLAERLGMTLVEETECLARLVAAGLITRRGRYRVSESRTIDTHGGQRALHRLKQHWALVAARRLDAPRKGDVFAYNVMSLSRDDLARVAERLRAAYREIRLIVSASAPEEVAALVNLQLVTFSIDEP